MGLTGTNPQQLNARRTAQINFWLERARILKQVSLDRIRKHPDRLISNLMLKGKPDWADADRPVGSFVHIALLEEMARAAGAQDQKYIDEFWSGLGILGPPNLPPALALAPDLHS